MSNSDQILIALIPVVAAAIGWGFWLAWRSAQVLTALELKLGLTTERLTSAEERIEALEVRTDGLPLCARPRLHRPP